MCTVKRTTDPTLAFPSALEREGFGAAGCGRSTVGSTQAALPFLVESDHLLDSDICAPQAGLGHCRAGPQPGDHRRLTATGDRDLGIQMTDAAFRLVA